MLRSLDMHDLLKIIERKSFIKAFDILMLRPPFTRLGMCSESNESMSYELTFFKV